MSGLHRSESSLDPSLFQYHQHFEGAWQLVGKTHLSEVRWWCAQFSWFGLVWSVRLAVNQRLRLGGSSLVVQG